MVLWDALSSADDAAVMAAVEAGANLDKVSPMRKNALDYACEYRSCALVNHLIERGARPQGAEGLKTNPFQRLVARDDVDHETIKALWLLSRKEGVSCEALLGVLVQSHAGKSLLKAQFPWVKVEWDWIPPRDAQIIVMQMDSVEPAARRTFRRI